jgi:biotin operon repressor|tara:strand:+ start:1407 stop:1586 length:180 start_codon:yes stop_codon:yes gene_type:complete
MKTKPIKIIEKALTDLWVRDIEKFLLEKNYSYAKVLMQKIGMSRKEINQTVKEFQEVQQ